MCTTTKSGVELFIESFKAANIASFTENGLRALFEYAEDYDGGEGETYSPHEMANMLSEYATALDAAKAIGHVPDAGSDESDVLDWLKLNAATVIEFNGGIIIYNPRMT